MPRGQRDKLNDYSTNRGVKSSSFIRRPKVQTYGLHLDGSASTPNEALSLGWIEVIRTTTTELSDSRELLSSTSNHERGERCTPFYVDVMLDALRSLYLLPTPCHSESESVTDLRRL